MRVLRCACMPPLAACLRLVLSGERVWSRRVRVLRTGVVLVSRPPARGPFLRGARSGSRGRALGLSFAVRGLDRVGALPPLNIG